MKEALDHILDLMTMHGTTGYYSKSSNRLIGFHTRDGSIAWYNIPNAPPENFKPEMIERGTPEQEFNRLNDAMFHQLPIRK